MADEEYLSNDPWAGVLGSAEQQAGLRPGLLTAISQQENVHPAHNNPLGLSTDAGVKTFAPQTAIEAVRKQAQLLANPTGPYAEFVRTGDINALAKVYSPPGARNDPYGTNVTEAAGIKANLAKQYLSMDPNAGMPKVAPATPQATLPTPGIASPTLTQEVGAPAPVTEPPDALKTMEAGLGADPSALEDFRKTHPQLYSAIANAAGGAYDVGKEFVQGLTTPSGLAGLVSPLPGAYEELKQSYDTLRGQPPPSPIAQAETTPPYSRERFKAGLGEIANVLMAGAIGKQIMEGPRPGPARPSPETVATPTVEEPTGPLEPPPVEGYARVAPPEAAPPAAAETVWHPENAKSFLTDNAQAFEDAGFHPPEILGSVAQGKTTPHDLDIRVTPKSENFDYEALAQKLGATIDEAGGLEGGAHTGKGATIELTLPDGRVVDIYPQEPAEPPPRAAEPPQGGDAPRSQVKSVLDQYDSDSQQISTGEDVAKALSDIEGLPPSLQKAVTDFDEAMRVDREEYGQRSGLPEDAENVLMDEVRKYAGTTEEVPAAAPPEPVATEPDFSHINDLKTLSTEGGRLAIAAKTTNEIQAVQRAMKKRAAEIEGGEIPSAGKITSTTRVSSPQVRPSVDEGAPLREQGQVAPTGGEPAQAQEAVTPPAPEGDIWYHAGTGEGTPVYLTRDKAWADAWAKQHGTSVKAFRVKGKIRQLAKGEPDALIWNSPYSSTFRGKLSKGGYVGIAETGPNAQLAITDPSAITEVKPKEVTPSAIEERQQQVGGQPEYTGVPQGANVPAYPEQVRQEAGGRPGGGGGVEPSPPITPQEAVAPAPPPAPVRPPPPVEPRVPPAPREPTSIKNVVTAAERERRGIPAAEEALRRDFPTEMAEADAREQADPGAGERLVDEINRKPRALDGTEVAQLLREQIRVQGEYDRAVDAVNSAKSPKDLVNAKIRLSEARDKAQAVYDADKRAGTAGGRGLNARKMMADQNYNLVRMEARFRASRNGKALTEPQARVVNAMHDKIKLAADKADAAARAAASHEEFQRVLNEAKQAPKEKGFLAKQADAARQRIIARRGRLNVGVDPGALIDEAIIGADHISRGLTKFGEWSRQMIMDFGERIRPYLKDLWARARAYHATTAEAKLATYKKGLATRTEKLRARIEAGDLTRARREKTQLDAEAFRMRAEYQRLRDQFESMVEKERLRNRSAPERIADTFVKAERALKLTGVTTLGKLASAGATRLIQRPIEGAIQSVLRIPLARIARESPLEGGLNLRAEAAAHTTGIAKGVKYIPKILMGKAIPEESIFARRDVRPAADTVESILDIPGKVHGAIKSIPKEVERARATQQLEDFYRKQGKDPNDPANRQAIGEAADQQAKRAVFMQDNVLASAWNNAMRSLESSKKFPVAGKTLSTLGRWLLPIVKVPTNIAGEVGTHMVGTLTGTAKLLQVMGRGLKTIKPEEADMIMRHYTKGMVGAGLFLTGYFNADKLGGFYQAREKRKPGDVKAGEAKIGDVTIPSWFLHSPAGIVLQAGATANRVANAPVKKTGGIKGAGPATIAVASGILRDVPFINEMGSIDSMLADNWDATKARGRLLTGSVVPVGLQNIAKWTDPLQEPQYRSPQNELDYLKMAIPGLREQVPLHQTKGRKSTSMIP